MDISEYGFIAPRLLRLMQCENGYPKLTEGLETSVPGLHVLGAPAAWSYRPLIAICFRGPLYSCCIDASAGQQEFACERQLVIVK